MHKMPSVGTKVVVTSAFLQWWDKVDGKGYQTKSLVKLGDEGEVVAVSEQFMSATIYFAERGVYQPGIPFDVLEEMRVKR